MIDDYIRQCELTEGEMDRLWTCCRFAFVNSKNLSKAALDENVPSRPLRVAMAYRVMIEESKSHLMTARSPKPRKRQRNAQSALLPSSPRTSSVFSSMPDVAVTGSQAGVAGVQCSAQLECGLRLS